MAFRYPVTAYTRAQLEIMSGPARASDLEAIPHVLFDTLAFTSASTLQLKFFQTVQATPDLGNITSAGQLPDPQFFQPYFFGCDPLVLTAIGAVVGTAPGPMVDMNALVMTSRPTISFTISGKPYILAIPLSFLHTSGGATGTLAGLYTTGKEQALNSFPDGGYCVNGSFIVPPKQAFDCTVVWPATVTLNASPVNIRLWIAGVLYRRVL